MRANNLVGVRGRHCWRRGRPNTASGPSLLKRDFGTAASDQLSVADITEFCCADGKLYLAGIRDLHNHSLVGWSMGQPVACQLVR
jgi:hypothetical protein